MRKLITTIALLALVESSVTIAQPAGFRGPNAPSSTKFVPDNCCRRHRWDTASRIG
jgi:hypothetical protein